MLNEKKIIISKEDIDRLAEMYGDEEKFDLMTLIRHIRRLEEDQSSNYSRQECLAFWKLFNLKDISDGRKFADELRTDSFQNRSKV